MRWGETIVACHLMQTNGWKDAGNLNEQCVEVAAHKGYKTVFEGC